jgi:hypothetical protein
MPRMLAIGPTQTRRHCQELRGRLGLTLKHVDEGAGGPLGRANAQAVPDEGGGDVAFRAWLWP